MKTFSSLELLYHLNLAQSTIKRCHLQITLQHYIQQLCIYHQCLIIKTTFSELTFWVHHRLSSSVESSNGDPDLQTKQRLYWHSVIDLRHWAPVNARSKSAWLILASSAIFNKFGILDRSQCGLRNIVARSITWWVSKYISGIPLYRSSRQVVSSLTWRRLMR